MPYSYVLLSGNGSATNFGFSFGYLSKFHIGVKVNGVVTTFTWVTDFTIGITPAPANGAVIEVRRTTPLNQPIVDWSDGSTLTEADMDLNTRFSLYTAQEAADGVAASITQNSLGQWDGQNRRAVNFADPVDPQDLVNKRYFEDVYTPQLDAKVTEATNQANNAASSAATAQGYALAADNSADLAAALLATFKGQYLGALASNPTLDGNGQPVTAGDLYFSTTENLMKVYTGSAWINAGSTVQSTIKRPVTPIVATAGQTVFPVSGGYDAPYILVFVNGVEVASPDVDVTNGSTIVFSSGLTAGDKVDYAAFGAFQVANPIIDGTSAADFIKTRNARVVTSIADLKALNKNTYNFVLVTGFYASGDGGGGFFLQVPTMPTNGIVQVGNDGGIWQLVVDRDYVSAKQLGARLDGSTDDSSLLNNAKSTLDALGKRLYIPSGVCRISTAITPPKAGVFGDSPQASIIQCNNCSAFLFPANFGLSRPACVIEKLGIQSYSNTCDGLYAFRAPGVASGASPVYNSGLTVRDVEIGTGGRFGGGFSLKDFFRVNVENIGMTDVSSAVLLTGSVVQAVFRNVTANGDNAPTVLNRYGFQTAAASYSSGTLGPEHISTWDCSFIRYTRGVQHDAGLMVSFNNTDLETFTHGFYLSQPCTVRGGISAPAPAASGTAAWIGLFKAISDFDVANGTLIDDLEINTLNTPGTPASSYGILIGNNVNRCVGTTIRSPRIRGNTSSMVGGIVANLAGGDIVIEDAIINGSVVTGTTVSVNNASYARVVGNRSATGGTVNGSLSITDNGVGSIGDVRGNAFAAITNTLNAYSGTWTPGTIPNGTPAGTTVAVPGAVAGDKVVVGLSSLIGSAYCLISGYVSSTGNVTVLLYNVSGASQTIPSGTLQVTVLKS